MTKRLVFEIEVARSFTIEGNDYGECWETFKKELKLMDADGKWVIPSKFDRGRLPSGLFKDEVISKHVKLREYSKGTHTEIYADGEECPQCNLDTLTFQLTTNCSGRLDPLAVCGGCGYQKLFCSLPVGSSQCEGCDHRVECLVQPKEV